MGARMRARLAGILTRACLLAIGGGGGGRARGAGAVDPAAQILSHTFVDNAYDRSSDTRISPQLGAREAQLLLTFAHDLDPENVHTLKLLVEAAATTGEADV